MDLLKDKDWRIAAITTLTKDFIDRGTKIVHPAGSLVFTSGTLNFKGKTITFPMPSVAALYLDFANQSWNESNHEIQDTDIFKRKHEVLVHNPEELFNILALRMGAVIFAYSAIEAHINSIIQDADIERKYGLDRKLSEYIPKMKGISSPQGTKIWSYYKRIDKLRDMIIHPKTKTTASFSVKDKNLLWHRLINLDYNPALNAKKVIEYYLFDKKPRWWESMPF